MSQELLEDLAKHVWDRIGHGERLGIRQNEETLTDNVLLDIAMSESPYIQVIKFDKNQEKETGADWEMVIQTRRQNWRRYAVQAKRINGKSYKQLRHKVGDELQVDLLESYAKEVGAIPLYCLFNHMKDVDVNPHAHWHCLKEFELKQLGCSIALSRTIKSAVPRYNSKTFDTIHTPVSTMPWRCLLCPISDRREERRELPDDSPSFYYEQLPPEFGVHEESVVVTLPPFEERSQALKRFFPREIEDRIPKYLLIVDQPTPLCFDLKENEKSMTRWIEAIGFKRGYCLTWPDDFTPKQVP